MTYGHEGGYAFNEDQRGGHDQAALDATLARQRIAMTMIHINPTLPPDFDSTPNGLRPESHREWWYRPFIVFVRCPFAAGPERSQWLEAWPNGVRYDVRCLDGGAWDRSTNHGSFVTLDGAVTRAKELAEELQQQGVRA